MDDRREPEDDAGRGRVEDPGADTGMFKAFAQRRDPAPPDSGRAFRLLTLLGGLVVFVLLVLLLLR